MLATELTGDYSDQTFTGKLLTAFRTHDLHPLKRAPAGRTTKKNPRNTWFLRFIYSLIFTWNITKRCSIISLSTVYAVENPGNTGFVVIVVAHTFHTHDILLRLKTFYINIQLAIILFLNLVYYTKIYVLPLLQYYCHFHLE